MSAVTSPALLLDRRLEMAVGNRPLRALGAGDVLLRLRWAGLCGSDLHVMRTGDWVEEWPATLGHEIYATVEEGPADGAFERGDHVVADSRIPCGRCAQCAAGEPNRCTEVRFVGEACPGGFANFCVLPSSLLHPVPEALHSATATLSEPLAVVFHGLSLLRDEPRRVAILGHGPIGALLHIELRRRFPGAEIHVAEPAGLRAQLARALEADTVSSTSGLAPTGFDTVVDAAGYPGSLADAVTLAGTRGQILLLALSKREVALRPSDLVERSLCIVGGNAFVDELPAAIDTLSREPWRYEPVITDAISLDELPQMARAQLERPQAVKVVVCP
jgi:threonine dehydrogenase-like Zn-dependent dehydrogenase